MEFYLHAIIPLLVSHFKQIDLRYGARDIHQSIDLPKLVDSLPDL
nr:hypothetical protein [Dyadobacter sp. CY261]